MSISPGKQIAPCPKTQFAALRQLETAGNPYPWTANQLNQALVTYPNLTVFLEDKPIAFILYRTVLDEAEIIHLICDSDHRGKGYASALLHNLCQHLQDKGVKKLFLEVRESNDAARALYKKMGFHVIGERKAYYANQENAIIMQKPIEKTNTIQTDYL